MKYYKIKLSFYNYNDKNKRITSSAKGNKIPNANYYFYEMREGKILTDAPLFDYFFLESFEKKKYWEKYLLDVHDFFGEGSQIMGWFVSEDLKLLLETFNLSQPHHFYPSKLSYKGEKIDYYIFQFAGHIMIDEIRTKCINWKNSVFFNPIDELRSIMKRSKYDKEIKLQKLALKEDLDFFPMATYLNDDIVSENLKRAIEEMKITGFEFSELDYEVVVDIE